MANSSKKKRSPKRSRSERRFEPQSTTSTSLVAVLGAIGAAAMGAGAYGQVLKPAQGGEPMAQAAWILAVGATLVGAAVWLGTSGDASLFVGDGGIGQEKSGIQRIPWHSIESLAFDSIGQRLVVRGNDEAGSPVTIHVSLKGHPQAAAWLLKEARQRIPSVVADLEISTLEPNGDAGVVVPLGDVQVVGKRCAASGKIIAFEPDARVCPQCERVYHKAHLPKACACGATLGSADATAVEGSHPADASSQGKKSEESSTS